MTALGVPAERPTAVDFHFDIMCPFAFHASRWIREVRELTDLQIAWMSIDRGTIIDFTAPNPGEVPRYVAL